MTSTELIGVIERWLNSAAGQLTLHIDGSPVVLTRYHDGVGCSAVVTLSVKVDDRLLHKALRYSSAAVLRLGMDAAALCWSDADEQLWLLMRREPDDPIRLCRALEALVNQRDVWQSLLAPLARPASPPPLNLKTLAFLQGDQHA